MEVYTVTGHAQMHGWANLTKELHHIIDPKHPSELNQVNPVIKFDIFRTHAGLLHKKGMSTFSAESLQGHFSP